MTSVLTWRLRLAAITAGLVLSHLGWEWSQGGIQSHHFMADASMPALSNAWGLLWLPLLAALYAPSIRRRAMGDGTRAQWRTVIIGGLLGGLVVGAGLAAIVMFQPPIEGNVVLGTLLGLSLLFQVWRGEVVLGFLAGAMVGVGALLPSIFAFLFALISLGMHRGLIPALQALRRRFA